MEVNWGNVESYSEVQSVNGLTGKVQLKIPTKTSDLVNDSGFVSNSNYATKAELQEVENKIPNVSNFATKTELSNVASNIPETYLKVANLGDGSLTIVNNKGESVVFTPAAAGGGGAVNSVNGQTGNVVLDIPTKVSELENDSGYLTSHQDISNLATKAELSAVETLSTVPQITNARGTPTIKFKGNAGSATDGGAINTMTPEEIAVAAAKGWTVIFAN